MKHAAAPAAGEARAARRVGIVGCGYVGCRLARRLRAAGHEVWGSARSEASRAAIRAAGATPIALVLGDPDALRRALADADAVVWLAPPTGAPAPLADALRARPARRLVYASTSAVYRRPDDPHDPDAWVDELSPVGPSTPRGQARLAQERAFLAALPDTRVVRIAGIYGPGRSLEPRLRAGQAFAPAEAGCGPVSRVHVDDLCRILQAALHPQAPPLVNACDDHPAPTLEVAGYTAALLGLPPPKTAPDAPCYGGCRLRSRYLRAWIGPLRYPSYREGLPAALAEDAEEADQAG